MFRNTVRIISALILVLAPVSLVAGELDRSKNLASLLDEKVGPLTERLSELNASLNSSRGSWAEIQHEFLVVTETFEGASSCVEFFMRPLSAILNAAVNQVPVPVLSAGLGVVSEWVTNSISLALKDLIEAQTHAQENQASLDSYNAAINRYRNVREVLFETEGKLDSYLSLMRLIRSIGNHKDLKRQLDFLIFQQDRQAEILMEIARKARRGDCSQSERLCPKKIEEMLVQVNALVHQASKLRQVIEYFDEPKTCRNLTEAIRVIFEGEKTIQKVRLGLLSLKGRGLWLSAFSKANRAEQNTFKNDYNEFFKTRANTIYDEYVVDVRNDSALYSQVGEAWNQCFSDRFGDGSGYLLFHPAAVHAFDVAKSRVKAECWREVLDPFSQYADPYLEKLSEYFKRRENRLIAVVERYWEVRDLEIASGNRSLYDTLVEEYDRFFVEITKEQSQENVRKRVESLLAKREEIQRLCSPRKDQ